MKFPFAVHAQVFVLVIWAFPFLLVFYILRDISLVFCIAGVRMSRSSGEAVLQNHKRFPTALFKSVRAVRLFFIYVFQCWTSFLSFLITTHWISTPLCKNGVGFRDVLSNTALSCAWSGSLSALDTLRAGRPERPSPAKCFQEVHPNLRYLQLYSHV